MSSHPEPMFFDSMKIMMQPVRNHETGPVSVSESTFLHSTFLCLVYREVQSRHPPMVVNLLLTGMPLNRSWNHVIHFPGALPQLFFGL